MFGLFKKKQPPAPVRKAHVGVWRDIEEIEDQETSFVVLWSPEATQFAHWINEGGRRMFLNAWGDKTVPHRECKKFLAIKLPNEV